MKSAATKVLATWAMVFLIATAGWADLSFYSQNFEGLVQADPSALASDGWLYFANVFDPNWNYLYPYGPGPAPNGGPAFSAVAAGEGGPTQGAQQLVVYSDYNNGDHANGNLIEANVFQEQFVGPGDVGTEWTFTFDAKLGDIQPPSTALAFIKTLDPNAGYALTNFVTVDMTAIPTTWNTYSLSLAIDGNLDGQIFQIGFLNVATNYTPSGILYDNITFGQSGPVSVESRSWGGVKSLYR